MKVPLNWVDKYIKIEHTPKEFGDIMTSLEFMQDGPIQEINNENIIDLEIRQNRPDMLSIIGVAREYAAYLAKKVKYPEETIEYETAWEKEKENLSVQSKDKIKRFCTVQIKNINIKKSPEYIVKALEAYGMTSKNNLVDITNYVMIEYGIPLHAFDLNKLSKEQGHSLLTIRQAKDGEIFETWQKTKIELDSSDIIVSDSKKPVAIAGIIGGANSDINQNTKEIILEAAVYDYASIRRTAIKHNIRTEASLRHEKFLNPEMVETAIKRATYLIQELCAGETVKIEDYYEDKIPNKSIDFNIFEIERLGGIHIEKEETISLLENLEFKITDQKEALGVNQDIIRVFVPKHRTDVNINADLVEEVLRLKGYEHIPLTGINSAPPDLSTPNVLILEEKIRDIFVDLGLFEHITNPLVKYTSETAQIKLENPLNSELDGLRTTIRETLNPVLKRNAKAGNHEIGLFEVGKVYSSEKKNSYKEERRIETIYSTDKSIKNFYISKVKPDFLAFLTKVGLNNENLMYKNKAEYLQYFYENKHVANLYSNGFEFFTEDLVKLIDIKEIPSVYIQSSIPQRITEQLSLVFDKKTELGSIAKTVRSASKLISHIEALDIYEDAKLGAEKVAITVQVVFEDIENKLTKEAVRINKEKIIKSLNKIGAKLRK